MIGTRVLHHPPFAPRRSLWRLAVLLAAALPAIAPSAQAQISKVPQDFATIQEAIDAASPGDEIVVAKGTYAGFLINGKSDLTLRGKGKVFIEASQATEGVVNPPVHIESSNDISVSKLQIVNASLDGVFVLESANVLLDRLRITEAGGNAIKLDGCTDVTIDRARIDTTGSDAIRTDGCLRITVDRCNIRDAGDDAVALSTGNPASPTDDSTVCRTKIFDPVDDGVDINGDGNTVERVTVRGALEDGFEVDTDGVGSGNSFIKCKAIKPVDVGFYVGGSMNTMERCKVMRAGDDAISLRGTGGHTVERAKISKPGFDGVFIADGSLENTLIDNRISGPGDDGLDVQTMGNTATGNRISKAADNGLEVEDTGNAFIENRMKGSKGLDISDTSGGVNTYTDNKFKTSNLE